MALASTSSAPNALIKYTILHKDTSNLWDQLRQIMREQRYTSQDHASVALMQEFPNCQPFFVVRPSDNYLLGALIIIETDEIIYGNVYVVREEFRAAGFGVKMLMSFLQKMADSLEKKPLIARSVKSIYSVYQGPPFHALRMYDLYIHEFSCKEEMKEFFLFNKMLNGKILDVKKMDDEQFLALLDYDKMVTGVDRSRFLKEYFSINFVTGVALISPSGSIIGLAGAVPTFEDGLYKIAPIFASCPEVASQLVHAVLDRVHHPEAHFVFHRRTESAGDWCHRRSEELGTPTKHVSIMAQSTLYSVRYEEKCRPELIFAPTNSPVHFDA